MDLSDIVVFVVVLLLILMAFFCCHIKNKSIFCGGSYVLNNKYNYDTIRYPEDVMKEYDKVDEEIFRLQLEHVNRYRRQYALHDKHIIIGDVHDSLLSTFIPLIEGNIIEEGSVAFDRDPNSPTFNTFTYKLTGNPDHNKVVYCGDVLGRGANRYAQCLLICLLDLSMEHHDWVVFCFGNHEISSGSMMGTYDDWKFPTKPKSGENQDIKTWKSFETIMREKLKAYYNAYPDALAYIFDGANKSYIVSHTFPRDSLFDKPDREVSRFDKMNELLTNKLSDYGEGVSVGMSFVDFNKTHGFNHSADELLDMYLNDEVKATNEMKDEVKKNVIETLDARKIAFLKKHGDNLPPLLYIDGPPMPKRKRILTPLSVDSSRKAVSDERSVAYYKALNNDGSIDRERLHTELQTSSKSDVVKEENLFYDGRPAVSDDEASIRDNEFRCYKTNSENVDWFIGHTPIQSLDKNNRNLTAKAAGNGRSITFHLMDTNNSNNSGLDLADNCKSFRKYMTPADDYKYSVELIYLAVVDTNTDEVDFYEWLEKDKALEDVRIRYDEYMDVKIKEHEKWVEEERARRRNSGLDNRDRLAEIRARRSKK